MRKIYNKITLAWNEKTQRYDDVVYEDSFMYDGEMALATATCQCYVGLGAEIANYSSLCAMAPDYCYPSLPFQQSNCSSGQVCVGPCNFDNLLEAFQETPNDQNAQVGGASWTFAYYCGATNGSWYHFGLNPANNNYEWFNEQIGTAPGTGSGGQDCDDSMGGPNPMEFAMGMCVSSGAGGTGGGGRSRRGLMREIRTGGSVGRNKMRRGGISRRPKKMNRGGRISVSRKMQSGGSTHMGACIKWNQNGECIDHMY